MDSPVIVDKASEFGEPIDLDHPFPGFPFDDEGFGRRSDIRAHLDDLAARHPEFADHLLGPPWGDIPFQSSFRNRNHRRGSGNGYQQQPQQQQQGYSDEDARSQASGSSAASGASVGSHGEPENGQNQQTDHRSHNFEHTPKKNQIPQYGLRNTVDIGQHRHNMENPDKGNRGQRSMSAPPENRQSATNQQQPQQEQQTQQQPSGQRYVSRIDITPQHNQPQHQQQQPQQQQQPPQPQQQPQQQQSQKPQQQQGNVRHIPIFVEGRDKPVLPRSFDEQPNFKREPSPTQFHAPPPPPPHFQRSSPFGDVFAGRHQWSPHFQDTFYQQPTTAFEHPSRRQQPPHSFEQSRKAQQQNYKQAKSQQKPQQQQSQQAQQHQQEPPPPKPKPTVPKDPLERVALIQKEIDCLAEQVKRYDGNSRTDKQYIYLDEMLTRQLIKLDDIETEGRDNVRQARKNAIKTIQETIGLLESKAPLPSQQIPANEQEEQDKQLSNDADKSGQITDSMDIDQQRAEDRVSNNDAEETTAGQQTEAATEADRKTTEIRSKEPIPLPPPCPSSEDKPEEKPSADYADQSTRETDVAPSQASDEPMDIASAEKSKPADPRQTGSATEEKAVEEKKPPDTVDEPSKKSGHEEAEQSKSDEAKNAKKTDTSEEEKKKRETENEKRATQEEQQRQKGDEKMDVDSEVKQSPKTQKKGKKTKKQQTGTASDKPIPLPAPESTTAASTK